MSLTVAVISASNLLDLDRGKNDHSDPYAVVTFQGMRQRTAVIKVHLRPRAIARKSPPPS